MKSLKKLSIALLISTALTGASFAHDMAHQANDTVANIADLGYASNKKLSITKQSMIDFYNDVNPFDATAGTNKSVKNAKAFLKSIIDGTADKFAGANPGEKKLAFVAALNKVLDVTQPLELDITIAGFNVGTAPAANKITAAVEVFFEKIAPKVPLQKSYDFFDEMVSLYKDGVLSGITEKELEQDKTLVSSLILKNIISLGIRITDLESQVFRLGGHVQENPQDIFAKSIVKTKREMEETKQGKDPRKIIPSPTKAEKIDPFLDEFPFMKTFMGFPFVNSIDENKELICDYKSLKKFKTLNMCQVLSASLGIIEIDEACLIINNVCKEEANRGLFVGRIPFINKLRKEYKLREELYENHGLNSTAIKHKDFLKWTQELELVTPLAFQENFAV